MSPLAAGQPTTTQLDKTKIRPFDVKSLIGPETLTNAAAGGGGGPTMEISGPAAALLLHSSPSPGAPISSPPASAVSLSNAAFGPHGFFGGGGGGPTAYPYLGVYQQLLQAAAAAAPNQFHTHHLNAHHSAAPVASFPPLNPLILNSFAAAAAASHSSYLAAAAAYPGLRQLSVIDRLKQNRFSPYPPSSTAAAISSSPASSTAAAISLSATAAAAITTESRSAFHSVTKTKISSPPLQTISHIVASTPPLPPKCADQATPPSVVKALSSLAAEERNASSPQPPISTITAAAANGEIKSIEAMVDTLRNGARETSFGITHSNCLSSSRSSIKDISSKV